VYIQGVVQHAVMRVQHRQMTKGLLTLFDVCDNLKVAAAAGQRCVAFRNITLKKAVSTWCWVTADELQQRERTKKCVQAWYGRQSGMLFRSWRSHATSSLHTEALVRRVAAKFLLRDLSTRFDSWKEFAQRAQLLQNACMSMLKSMFVRGFKTWLHNACRMMHDAACRERAGVRMERLLETKAWNTWRVHSMELMTMRGAGHRAAVRWHQRCGPLP
jgi:hypothetical protein